MYESAAEGAGYWLTGTAARLAHRDQQLRELASARRRTALLRAQQTRCNAGSASLTTAGDTLSSLPEAVDQLESREAVPAVRIACKAPPASTEARRAVPEHSVAAAPAGAVAVLEQCPPRPRRVRLVLHHALVLQRAWRYGLTPT